MTESDEFKSLLNNMVAVIQRIAAETATLVDAVILPSTAEEFRHETQQERAIGLNQAAETLRQDVDAFLGKTDQVRTGFQKEVSR